VPDHCLPVIEAALTDAHLLGEDREHTARRVAQYLISSGYTVTPAALAEGASQ
jgi:predicted CoA-binding protein